MACIDIFKSASKGGRLIKDSKGNIETVITKDGEDSGVFKNILDNIDVSKIKSDSFDTEFLDSLQNMGYLENWKENKTEAALGLYAKLFTNGFISRFGDWVAGESVRGELLNGEPNVSDGNKVFIGASEMKIYGEGAMKDNSISSEEAINEDDSLIWVTPGTSVSPYIAYENKKASKLDKLPKYTVDKALKSLASSNKAGEIFLRPLNTLDEFYHYFEGKDITNVGSIQKKKVLEMLSTKGYPIERIKELITTKKEAHTFLILHEQSHVENKDADIYWKDEDARKLAAHERGDNTKVVKNYLTQDKLDIELRATLDAFKKMIERKGIENSTTVAADTVHLEEEVMKTLDIENSQELEAWKDTKSEEEIKEVFSSVAKGLSDAGIKVVTSDESMIDEATLLYYTTDPAKIEIELRDMADGLLEWNLNKATDASNKYMAKVSTSKGKKVNMEESGNSLLISRGAAGKDLEESAASTLEVFDALLKSRPELIIRGYDKIIGSKLSADVKSQLLSAATDNAKELILGEIGANNDTNGIITAMLVMGYDLNTVVDFLHSPVIQKVLEIWEKKKDKKDLAPLTWHAIKKDTELERFINRKEMISLRDILQVSADIMGFGGIRSLSENFKIGTHELESIMDGVHSDALYEAILRDDTQPIEKAILAEKAALKGVAKDEDTKGDVFNPNYLIFYHPQSRSIFKKLYENERFLLPAMFDSIAPVKEYMTKFDRNEDSYKNLNRHLSTMYVEKFFSSKDSEGKFKTGVLTTDTEFGEGLEAYELNTFIGREKFVEEFPAFLSWATKKLKSLGYENIALENMTFDKSYSSEFPLLNIRSYKSSQTDDIVKASIVQSIEDMKLEIPGNNELNELHKTVYSNLSYYAMITSRGQDGATSMIGLFSEINKELSKFIKTLDEAFYQSILPTPTKDTISDNVTKKLILKSVQSYDAVKAKENVGEENDYQDEGPPPPQYDDDFMSEVAKDNLSTAIYSGSIQPNKVFSRPDIYGLQKDIFLSRNHGVSYRIFSSALDEALPNSMVPDAITVPGVDAAVLEGVALAGYQVGKSVNIDGKKARVLNYIKAKTFEIGGKKYSESVYTVAIAEEEGFVEIPGAVLMHYNPGTIFSGNMMSSLDSSNYNLVENRMANLEKITKGLGGKYVASIDTKLNTLKIDGDIRKSAYDAGITDKTPVVFEELSLMGTAESIITLDESRNKVYNLFKHENAPKSPLADTFLVPGLRTIADTGDRENAKIEIIDKIQDKLTNVEIGTDVYFKAMDTPSTADFVSGADLLRAALTRDDNIDLKIINEGDGVISLSAARKTEMRSFDFNGKKLTFRLARNKNTDRLVISGTKSAHELKQAKLYGIYKGMAGDSSFNANNVKLDGVEYLHLGIGDIAHIYLKKVDPETGNITFESPVEVATEINKEDFMMDPDPNAEPNPDGSMNTERILNKRGYELAVRDAAGSSIAKLEEKLQAKISKDNENKNNCNGL